MAEHTHSWAADNGLAGIACRDCHVSGWDWQQDEIRRLQRLVEGCATGRGCATGS